MKAKVTANLPSTIWPAVRCVVISSSSVPRARSSAKTRMVTSGIAPTRVSPRVSITGKKTLSQRFT
jgi:hypothetical protein